MAAWQPTRLLRVEAVVETSMRVVRAVTDAGKAYVKPLGGGDAGPHPLACDYVGTALAAWFGVPVPEMSILKLTALDAELVQEAGGRARPGPALASRAVEPAHPWSGAAAELAPAVNLDTIPRLVAFDTWTLNWDRHPPEGDPRRPNYGNLLLRPRPTGSDGLELIAIDHGECFTVGQELGPRIAEQGRVRSEAVYGLFDAFRRHVGRDGAEAAAAKLATVERDRVESLVDSIPGEWEVDRRARAAVCELVLGRAQFLAENIVRMLAHCNGKLF